MNDNEAVIAARAIRAAAQGTREANDHIQASGGTGYDSGFHYALSCIESVASFIEGARKETK